MNIYDRAGYYLSRGDKSVKEVRNYLKRKNYEDFEIDKVIETLREAKYLDDKRYAVSFIRYSNSKGYGKRKIVFDLRNKKGVSSEDIEDAYYQYEKELELEKDFEEEFSTEEEKAYKVTKKIFEIEKIEFDEFDRVIISEKIKNRIIRRLNSYGYSYGIIKKSLERLERYEKDVN